MRRPLLLALAGVTVLFSLIPIVSVHAQLAQIDAASVYTPVRGAGGPLTQDSNGDWHGGFIDGGFITGAFSAQASCAPPLCGNFSRQVSFTLHTATGVVDGSGTAICSVCVVAGMKGSVSLMFTVTGHGEVTNETPAVTLDGGTWLIAGSTGELAGISGAGTWTVTTDGGMSFAGEIALQVTDQAITASGRDVTATEGLAATMSVATFNDPDANATAGEYSASIDWGDGSSSVATIAATEGGSFSVMGAHTYGEEGDYAIAAVISDSDNPSNTATTRSTATVGDAPLTAGPGCQAASPADFNGTTAEFADAAGTYGTASDFTATIAWGDGGTSQGVIAATGGGTYKVSGAHQYLGLGTHTITTTINDEGGSTTSTSCTTTVFAFAAGGSFVIGDLSDSGKVVFWGAQWARANGLSGGAASSSFKGFADGVELPACSSHWVTDPGTSSEPPDAIPSYMAVVVSSSIESAGSALSGDIVHVVVVKTDRGYEPDAGHSGTGTVVALVC